MTGTNFILTLLIDNLNWGVCVKKNFVFIMLVVSLVFGVVGVYGQAGKAAFDRGEAAFKQKNWDKAIAEYTEAIRLNPNYTDAYTSRGAAYLEKGSIDLARSDVNSALKIDPNNKAAKDLNSKIGIDSSQVAFLNSIFDNFSPQESTPAPATQTAQKYVSDSDFKAAVLSDGKSVRITEYTGSKQAVVIPSSIQGLPVTAISGSPFQGKNITSVTIPSSVTSVYSGVFSGCASLTSINVDGNNKSYTAENGILYNKNKTTLCIYPAGKTGSSFTVPNSVTTITSSAFNDCKNLASITIPAGVTMISYGAFSGCAGLTVINVAAGNSEYTSENGILYSKDKTILHTYPGGKTAVSFSIPATVDGIGEMAFSFCANLTSVTIPDSVINISEGVFEGCARLASITIPARVLGIGEGAFLRCPSLVSVTFQGSIDKENFGYYYDPWDDEFDEGDSPFYGDLKEKYLAGGRGTYTTTAPVGNNSKWTKQSATTQQPAAPPANNPDFEMKGTTLVKYNGNATNVIIPTNVISIGKEAFYGRGLIKSVIIPSSVTSIGERAFGSCQGLTSITIPSSVTSIDGWAFSGLMSLTSVTIQANIANFGKGVFSGCHKLTNVTLQSGVTKIGDRAFESCKSLTSITIPSSVTSIGVQSFGDSGLTSITIPSSVTSIGDYAFYSCNNLTTITLSRKTTIGNNAIPSSVKIIYSD